MITVHGLGMTLHHPMNVLPLLHRLRFPVLNVSYRNDPGAPKSPDGIGHLGDTEWQDVDAALRFASRYGAERVILYGWSVGAAMALRVADHSSLRRRVIEAFQRYRTPLNMGIELPTIEAIKRFVAMGNGVALVPHLTVARELETGDLVRVFVDELDIRRVLRLVHRRQATLSYAGKAFLHTLKELARRNGPPFYFQVERNG